MRDRRRSSSNAFDSRLEMRVRNTLMIASLSRVPSRPDGVFLAILRDALEFMIDQLSSAVDDFKHNPSSWAEIYPDLATFFSPQLAKDTFSRLLEASKAQSLYVLTDYHWYLVHIALERPQRRFARRAFGADPNRAVHD